MINFCCSRTSPWSCVTEALANDYSVGGTVTNSTILILANVRSVPATFQVHR